jgi:hypothetical protein
MELKELAIPMAEVVRFENTDIITASVDPCKTSLEGHGSMA